MPFVASHQPSAVLQPREEPFHLPPPHVPAQGPAVPGPSSTVATVRRDQRDPALPLESRIQAITVVRSVANQHLHVGQRDQRVQRGVHQRHFMWRSASNPHGHRKSSAVCNRHDLGPLLALGLPDEGAPFVPPANVPSIKQSDRSSAPRFRDLGRARGVPGPASHPPPSAETVDDSFDRTDSGPTNPSTGHPSARSTAPRSATAPRPSRPSTDCFTYTAIASS